MSDLKFDVIIVGGGVAGLAAAIKLKQLASETNKKLSVCILEKGSEIGAHIISGNIFETRALDELIPDWRTTDIPVTTKVMAEKFFFLTEQKAYALPIAKPMQNKNNYIISLSNLCRWLGKYAENMGIEIYAGFAVAKCIFDNNNVVCGVETTPVGIDKNGQKTARYEPGVQIFANNIMLAEGCRGHNTQKIIRHYNLDKYCQPQTYALGIKEVWELDKHYHQQGLVVHSVGWPLNNNAYGGAFIYHMDNNQIAYGLITALDYKNTYLNPYQETQRLKHHPKFVALFASGKRISYGARSINEGGFQSIPKLNFPGGVIIGCAAGFLNVVKIKGTHTAIKSGMLAAEAVFEVGNNHNLKFSCYEEKIAKSWIYQELHQVRNIRAGFKYGLLPGLCNAAFEIYITKGYSPWTFKYRKDHLSLKPAKLCKKITYPKPDNKISFDLLSNLAYSATNHEENQPAHLILRDPSKALTVNYKNYDSPETRYCPAGVYEIQKIQGKTTFIINGQNCLHCKACDIKDYEQNIQWITPQGIGGPNYYNM